MTHGNSLNALYALSGRRIAGYRAHLQIKPLQHRKGWTHFSLYLEDSYGRQNLQAGSRGRWHSRPAVEGIHSSGGKWVLPWIEIGDYFPTVYFKDGGRPSQSLDLATTHLDQAIFDLFSEVVPPGGHLMFAYEVSYESPFHQDTLTSLMRGAPPVSTPPGALLFHAGFRLVKDWYLAEGGHEGPRKLWGEKPPNEAEAFSFDRRTFVQLMEFLARQPYPPESASDQATRKRSLAILNELKLAPELHRLKRRVLGLHPPVNEDP